MMLLDVVILHAGSRRAARGPSALMPRALREEDAPCFGVHECDPSRGGRCRGPRALTGARSMLIELRALVGSGTLTRRRPRLPPCQPGAPSIELDRR